MAHGCQAGLHQEACETVYRNRIQRGREAYSTFRLGAFGSDLGAIACFFKQPWENFLPDIPEPLQAWLLNEAAYRLRGLGRLNEALDPFRAALKSYETLEDWRLASCLASNLSKLDLTLGDVKGAIVDAEQSVTYANRSDDASQRIAARATLAEALHQAGKRAEAEKRFREAEDMQAKLHPDYQLLHLLPGFQYCDLLLSESEQAVGKAEGGMKGEELLAKCRAVRERAEKMFKWRAPSDRLLDIALEHLTRGRAELHEAILETRNRLTESAYLSASTPEASQRGLTFGAAELDHAVSGLRRSGRQDHLPRGLLTRAWLRSLTGPRTGPDSAQSDLEEAWEIAERGPMPLHRADIHLYRARLFFREKAYPWQSPQDDLAEARRLIFKHGYLRRKEELEDAEAALEHFGNALTP